MLCFTPFSLCDNSELSKYDNYEKDFPLNVVDPLSASIPLNVLEPPSASMSLNVLEPPSASMPLNVRAPYIKPSKKQVHYNAEDLSQGQERVPLGQDQVYEEGFPV